MSEFFQEIRSRFGMKGVVAFCALVVLIVVAAYQYFMAPRAFRVTEESGVPGSDRVESKVVTGGFYGRDMAVTESLMPPIPGGPPAATPTLPKTDRKIIKNGSLDLLVARAEEAIRQISAAADRYEGFTDASNVYEVSEGVKAGWVTIRVPTAHFQKVFDEIKMLAIKVRNENTNAQDVTAQFVDLEAQLKNYKAEEVQYQEIMKRAVKIEDVLSVASRLADVRGRIESVQGQINYLSRQIEMSAITVSLTSEAEVEVFGIIWRPLTVLKQAVKSSLTNLTRFADWLIAALFNLPVLILKLVLFAAVLAVVWKILKRIKKKFFGGGVV